MNNSKYWRKRFEQLEDGLHNRAVEYFNDLADAYERASNNISKEIEAWYKRFAEDEGVTYQEAKKMLTKGELKAFRMDVKEYIKKGKTLNYSKEFEDELRQASTKWHVTRLESLNLRIQQAIEELYDTELDGVIKTMDDIYTQGYYHTAYEVHKGLGFGWNIAALDTKRVTNVLSNPWTTDGMNFSERIWGKHRPELVQYMKKELTQTIIRGESSVNLVNNITKKFNVKRSEALTLVATESAFFASASQADCFNDLGVEQYGYVATLDMKTSEFCRDLDGKVFDMTEREIGINSPPMHPRCRSTTCPYFNDEFTVNNMRAARDKDGKTYLVPASMKYEEWYKQAVKGVNVEETVKISPKKSSNEYSVDRKLVNSKSYHDKFEGLTPYKATNESIYQNATRMLEHRDGTGFEDLVLIDSKTGKKITENISSTSYGKTGLRTEQYNEYLNHDGKIGLIHNHPNSSRLSYKDIKTMFDNDKIDFTVSVGHNGNVHIAYDPDRSIDIDKSWNELYNVLKKDLSNDLLAKHRALDALYESGIFKHESR